MDTQQSIQVEEKPKVLIIDDCVDVHRLLKARLKSENADIIGAESGEDGIAMAAEEAPVLILLDLDMPGKDGFEVLRGLKEDPATCDILVIVLSGLDSPDDKVTAFDLGAFDYITKPFELTELRVRVRSAMRMNSLVQMLSQRAQVDGLTGLWNRRYFDQRWEEAVSASSRNGSPLSLAVMDADHFKSVNDTFGHPAGDAVLQGLAKKIDALVRKSDVACRYGGEEFVIILPDTGPESAKVLVDRLRAEIGELQWPRHPERKITVSIGVAGSEGGSSVDPAGWVEIADKALYRAKMGGRNQVVVTEISPGSPKLAEAS